jgi:hypothetical protein
MEGSGVPGLLKHVGNDGQLCGSARPVSRGAIAALRDAIVAQWLSSYSGCHLGAPVWAGCFCQEISRLLCTIALENS